MQFRMRYNKIDGSILAKALEEVNANRIDESTNRYRGNRICLQRPENNLQTQQCKQRDHS